MKTKTLIALGTTILFLSLSTNTKGAIIAGPNLTSTTGGHSNTGIRFEALNDVILVSAKYNEIGNADTIQLQNASGDVILQSTSSVAGDGQPTINLNWSLTAGTTYRLIAVFANSENGKFATSSFPVSSSDIRVTSGVFSSISNFNGHWGGFNDIVTTSVPEPSSSLILGFGALGYLVQRKRRN